MTAPGWPTPKCCTDEKASTAVAFLGRAIAFYARHGIIVERVMTDNGERLPLRRSTLWPAARSACDMCAPAPGPLTNGKAERFIRTMLAGWAYGAIYGSSRERTAALDGWLYHYNYHRRHRASGNTQRL